MKVNEEEVNVYDLHICQLKADFEAMMIWEIWNKMMQSRPKQIGKIPVTFPWWHMAF